MATIKEMKPKMLNTLDYLVGCLQADSGTPDAEWQVVMIARECLASSSVVQLQKAVAKVAARAQSKVDVEVPRHPRLKTR
jgi:hypothetical protein